jgi:hypothetical protein
MQAWVCVTECGQAQARYLHVVPDARATPDAMPSVSSPRIAD